MSDKVRKILLIIFSFISIGCAGYLVWYYGSARDNAEDIDDAKEIAEVQETEIEEPEKVVIPIDFAGLQEENPDVHAWIKIEDTMIDYPIVQSEDDEYYLNRNWKKKQASEGAIFTQKYNKKDFSDYNTLVYGHRMGENVETMFHQLRNYTDEEFMKNHKEIIIYTPEHILTYHVFGAVVYDDRHILFSFDLNAEEGRQEFLDSFFGSNDMRNQFNDDVTVTAEDRIITLSTCISGERHHRFIVGAVLVDEK